jgi:putative chitinase
MISITHSVKLEHLNNSDLLVLQKALIDLGYNPGPLDGIYGPMTLSAFNAFKGDFKLTELGVIGPYTAQILSMAVNEELEKKEQESRHPQQGQILKPFVFQPKEINWYNFSSPISQYFTVGEVSRYDRERIVTNPIHRQNVIQLAQLLDAVRKDWGSGIGVTSWYRPPAINRIVGGVRFSTHLNGSGVDIYPLKGDICAFQGWLESRWPRALGRGCRKGFVHLDLRTQPPRLRWPY